MIKFRIYLTAEKRQVLEAIVSKSKVSDMRKAHVLLASDESSGRQTESSIGESYHPYTNVYPQG